jgi:hypothetical protein
MNGTTYPSCVLWTQYDFTAAAGLFSQAAGLLAGFAFTAITIVMSTDNSARQRGGFVSGAGCALLGLIATTTLYAANAAERGCALVAGSAATTEVLAGVAFAASVYTLLFALAELVSGMPVGRHLRYIVTLFTPPVVVLFVVASLSDFALTFADPPKILPPEDSAPPQMPPGVPTPIATVSRDVVEPRWLSPGAEPFWSNVNKAAIWLPALVFAICLVACLSAAFLRLRHPGWQDNNRGLASCLRIFKEWIPYAGLALVVVAVGATVNLSTLDPTWGITRGMGVALVGGVAVLLSVMSAILSFLPETGTDTTKPGKNKTPAPPTTGIALTTPSPAPGQPK